MLNKIMEKICMVVGIMVPVAIVVLTIALIANWDMFI